MHRATALAIATLIAVPAGPSYASESAGIMVSPVIVEFGPSVSVAAVVVTNHESHAITFQVSTMTWRQTAGADVLAPTDALIAAPVIFTVAAGGSQIIRFGLRAASDEKNEIDYRVFLTEIPPQPHNSLTVALRFSLPVFVAPTTASERLRWSGRQLANGAYRITLTNDGNVHVHLCFVRIADPNDVAHPLYHGVWSAYALPGQTRAWDVQLKPAPRSGVLALSAQCAEGTVRAELPVTPP